MAHTYYNLTGLEIRPDGSFYADLLWDYLNTTTYKWRCNSYRTIFLIEDFEFSEQELLEKLQQELSEQEIQADYFLSE